VMFLRVLRHLEAQGKARLLTASNGEVGIKFNPA